MNTDFVEFVHDDITWCSSDCPMTDCRRNSVNIINKSVLHSFADFRGSAECMISPELNKCIDGCSHARECFAKHKDPCEAIHELTDVYCDHCMFSSIEED